MRPVKLRITDMNILKREPGLAVPRYFNRVTDTAEADEILMHFIKHHCSALAAYECDNIDSDHPVAAARGGARVEYFAQRVP